MKGASKTFSQTLLVAVILSLICTAVCLMFPDAIMHWCGASDINIVYLRPYYMVLCTATLAIVLQSTLGILLILFHHNIVGVFFSQGTEIYEITLNGLNYSIVACLFVGMNIFASGIFTAFLNGGVSGGLSMIRTMVILVITLILFSHLWGITGLWLAWPVTELISLVISIVFLYVYRKKYEYVK